jgi:hypothetical protein
MKGGDGGAACRRKAGDEREILASGEMVVPILRSRVKQRGDGFGQGVGERGAI